MKTVFKSIAVAFSIYSKIPMPRFAWGSEEMRYHLIFFPWIGALIGGLEWVWYLITDACAIGGITYLCLAITIPLMVTGGFHVDGFMDTMDAVHSYQEREKKLEILKDPHIGAFSVICLVMYFLLALGFGAEINQREYIICLAFMFFAARAFSGLSVVYFPFAKEDGMAHMFSSTAQKNTVKIVLIIELVLSWVLAFCFNWKLALISIATEMLVFLYFYCMSKKIFGGITGDLCGFFVTVLELVMVMVMSICCMIGIG